MLTTAKRMKDIELTRAFTIKFEENKQANATRLKILSLVINQNLYYY